MTTIGKPDTRAPTLLGCREGSEGRPGFGPEEGRFREIARPIRKDQSYSRGGLIVRRREGPLRRRRRELRLLWKFRSDGEQRPRPDPAEAGAEPRQTEPRGSLGGAYGGKKLDAKEIAVDSLRVGAKRYVVDEDEVSKIVGDKSYESSWSRRAS
jgi:hypothetical protein